MSDPLLNPANNKAISGRARRFVINSVEVVRARLDQPTKDTLRNLQRTLGSTNADFLSASMFFRRALAVYRGHVCSLMNDPQALQAERLLLTLNSRLPKPRKKEQPRLSTR